MWAFLPVYPRAEVLAPVERLTIRSAAGGSAIALDVEMARSEQQKAVGLMFRTKLADNQGMLFIYPDTRIITMWMRNTYIPLDMVFIRPDGIIDSIHARAEPHSEAIIASERPVSAVLEIAGGAAERLGIKAGDKVSHQAFTARP